MQGYALCDIVAATNINNINAAWSCDSNHVPLTPPCGTTPWSFITCSGNAVTKVEIENAALVGL